MFYRITHNQKETFAITTPGDHVFVVANASADLTVTIDHSDAHVRVLGTYDARTGDRYTLRVLLHHRAPGARSSTDIRGVLRGTAHVQCTGIIRIDDTASGTDAALSHRTLLLSPRATVRTEPILEIHPADVTCTHAATVSAPDAAQIAYLRSRGLSRAAAIRRITTGFLAAQHS